MKTTTTFSSFLRTTEGRRWCPNDEFCQRLAAANIASLTALLRWARERYPREYKSYHFLSDGNGREIAQRLWATYLKWKER